MLPNRQQPIAQENPLWVSWHDTQMMASLNPQNVMDYFCRKSNPFYDRMCNNETIRMQRLGLENLHNMVGLEYILLHVHEPILYVIRKQHRHNPQEATPIADYYIIGGTIYKAPDLGNVISSRILSTVTNLQSAFEEASSYSRYHPNKGYTWDFSSNKQLTDKSRAAAKKDAATAKDDSGTVFQMQRVDMLLAELLRKFPPPIPPIIHQQQIQQQVGQPLQNPQEANANSSQDNNTNSTGNNGNPSETSPTGSGGVSQQGIDIKQENVDMKPPPEKKSKAN
ncbi:mediator of RNA polymerase II transcription subunit 6 [Lucilia sericata]|uniref:mediator of RNA polymerase II transcription subunit 6 n=1 Tax=Lucilia sericata TaxID=13632 RepID=UPI0018A82C65|nr:mediator of RNA polymerase II transcription subunit 6 [Lucilia sericata]XP_037812759.1 mediator of RNA polymerase II transcription subunit 6 [Lucilia sericata]XP_037812762.1 mediator of RNA polymerase II transcription subunit 6 [Lucilia sericata]